MFTLHAYDSESGLRLNYIKILQSDLKKFKNYILLFNLKL
jgi:hypothetical protein